MATDAFSDADLPRPIPWLSAGASPVSASDAPGTVPPLSPPAVPKGRRHLPIVQSSSKTKAARGPLAKLLRRKPRPGSGLPARPLIRALVWARRVTQTFFLGLFLWLLTQTALRDTSLFEAGGKVRLPWTVEGFLLADPFVALLTLLSSHRLYAGLAWSLGVIFLTLLFGRVFCGWICPFGTIHHVLSYLWPSPALKGMSRIEKNRSPRFLSVKYYLLVGCLFAAMTGTALGGLLDPLCVLFRSVSLGVLPAMQYVGVRFFQSNVLLSAPSGGAFSDATLDVLGEHVWTAEQAHFHEAWLVLGVFAATVALNRFVPRFWCRVLCPLGALLGVISRFSLFGLEKDHHKCTDCNLCLSHCQGADRPEGGVKHQQAECHLCFNCEAACPEDVLHFKFFPGKRSRNEAVDVNRRSLVASAALGVSLVPTMRVGSWPDKGYAPNVIRPPGALPEREFLDRCIRCAECMKVCPNNALHPAFFEAGPEGLWTPILIPRIGYCEHSCVLCGQVCPTGAIAKIEERDKLGIGVSPIRIGTAMFDRGRCLPWAMATPCTVCEEFCPTSPKSIWVEEVLVPKRGGAAEAGQEPGVNEVLVKRPHVDPSLCIGCGACEKVCPVVDKPAVYVTSAGESRSKTNLILLEDTAYGPG